MANQSAGRSPPIARSAGKLHEPHRISSGQKRDANGCCVSVLIHRDAELAEANVRARLVRRAAVPHGAEIARRDLDERGIRVMRAGIVERLLLTPRSTRGLE